MKLRVTLTTSKHNRPAIAGTLLDHALELASTILDVIKTGWEVAQQQPPGCPAAGEAMPVAHTARARLLGQFDSNLPRYSPTGRAQRELFMMIGLDLAELPVGTAEIAREEVLAAYASTFKPRIYHGAANSARSRAPVSEPAADNARNPDEV